MESPLKDSKAHPRSCVWRVIRFLLFLLVIRVFIFPPITSAPSARPTPAVVFPLVFSCCAPHLV
jgi:hypothetical protein